MNTKEKILEILLSSKGKFVSGEHIANTLGISRGAVWKAIKALKEQGYSISAVTNKGYSLTGNGGKLTSAEIRSFLPQKYSSLEIRCMESVDSTNSEAKRVCSCRSCQEPILFCAEEQTSGKGRMGRSFYSPKSTGVYFSLLFSPHTNTFKSVSITTAAAVCVTQAIEELTALNPQIKWVNDVYLNGKKICGILSEAVTDFESGGISDIVIGIGINISTSIFPDEISEKATSLGDINVSRSEIVAKVCEKLLDYCANPDFSKLLPYYKSHCFILGKNILYKKGNIQKKGIALDIDENGGLVIKTENGDTATLNSGEISIRYDK